jgi:DNA-directed RNA polymerase subunit RPC12/RpoP
MTYTLNKEERIVGKGETALVRAPEVRQQLDILGEAQTKEQELLDGLNDRLVDANSEREGARLAHLRAEQAVESARRSRERLELRVIEHAFPTGSETARYIIAQLVAEEICLTCSTVVPDYAIELHRRLETAACPVCNSPTATRSRSRVPRKLLARAESDLDSAEEILGSTKTRRERSEGEYVALLDQISELSARTAARDAEMGELTKRLPPEEVGVRDRRDSLNASKARLAGHRERLLRLREDFASVQLGINEIIAESAEQVKGAFAAFAHGFLFEDCSLAWTVFRDRVGEGGMLIDFPAFQLDMSGASFSSPVRRSGPQFVSESQREFVDLAFKMALISVATGDAGTIVVDAPESSLDAVFVSRAADVLNRFAVSSDKKRLVITSNLIEGDLIPELLWRADIRSPRNSRILDLLRVAAPTAAIVAMHPEYEEVRNRLFAKAREKLDE